MKQSSHCLTITLLSVSLLGLTQPSSGEVLDEASSSSTTTRFRFDPNDNLDPFVTAWLEQDMSQGDFWKLMSDYASSRSIRHKKSEALRLHQVYTALHSFERSCNIRTLNFFTNAITHVEDNGFVNEEWKKVLLVMLRDKPNERYVEKCFNEFDSMATALYSRDTDANEFIDMLVPSIKQETIENFIYVEIKNDLNPLISGMGSFKNIVFNRKCFAVCENIKPSYVVKGFHSRIQTILFPHKKGLRSPTLLERLKHQLFEPRANAIRVFMLFTFCSEFML